MRCKLSHGKGFKHKLQAMVPYHARPMQFQVHTGHLPRGDRITMNSPAGYDKHKGVKQKDYKGPSFFLAVSPPLISSHDMKI
jgi:hypothetical protein